jgi:hypothetical protein
MQINGSLLFAARGTRPDIAPITRELTEHNVNPGPEHLTAAKRVLRYLNATRTRGISYTAQRDQTHPTSYADADWAESRLDRKSISGQIFMFTNGPISWSSRKQRTVAKSSMEAEYVAAGGATAELLWLRSMFAELCMPIPGPSTLFVDNTSAIASANAQASHAKTKHIDIQHHFIRDHINAGDILIKHIPSKDNLADLLTKNLARPRFDDLLAMLNMRDRV